MPLPCGVLFVEPGKYIMQNIETFIQNYSVALPEAEVVPLRKKIDWWISQLLHKPREEESLPYPAANISYWRPESGKYVNFGDELAKVIPELILAGRGATLMDEVAQPVKIVTVGSSLHRANDGTIIWGTGLHGASPARDHTYRSLDVRAVRGPLTAKFLRARGIHVPPVYGDPGLLMPEICKGRFVPTGRRKIGLVPNLHEMDFFTNAVRSGRFPDVTIIDPRRAWNTVIQEILDFRFIIASSLHGLVIADAYGIPNRYVRLTEKENILKYHDYYLGTGRMLHPAKSLEEAIETEPATALAYDPAPLMAAFPYDIWGL